MSINPVVDITDKQQLFRDTVLQVMHYAMGTSGGSRRCAEFILSLYDGRLYRCDLQELLYIDVPIHRKMTLVFEYLYYANQQLADHVCAEDIAIVVDLWGLEFAATPE